MPRIVVIGTSGSGKTTLARELAARLGIPHLELDAIHWQANWTPMSNAALLAEVERLTSTDSWVTDGNYAKLHHLTLGRADVIIWLDYPMSVVFTRVLRRTLSRWWNGLTLWNGNRERLWTQFCSRDSLLLWVIQTWRIYRRDYPVLLRTHKQRGARVLRFHTNAQTRRWLDSFAPARPSAISQSPPQTHA